MFNDIKRYIDSSLERKIPLAIFVVLMVVLGTSFFLVIQNQRRIDFDVKIAEVQQTASLLHSCIDYSMLNGDMEGVEEILLRAAEAETVKRVRLFSADLDEVMDAGNQNLEYESTSNLTEVKTTRLPTVDERYHSNGRIGYYDPVINTEECLDCHEGTEGELLGVIETIIDTNDLIARHKANQFLLSTIAWVVVFITGGILYFLVHRMVVSPIRSVSSSILDIASGEGDLTRTLDTGSDDELGELSAGFNMFVNRLHSMVTEIKNITETIGKASGDVSDSSERMAVGAEEQQAQLSEVATSIEEMSAMILETSTNSEGTQGNASLATEAAHKGKTTVDQTISGIEGIASIVRSASSKIDTLKDRSQEIANVIQVIDDISDQTNLLALNANIEAARAGDAGRGFAVVADEVRKLAERTIGATADIEGKIQQIQLDVNASVEAMDQISERSTAGQALAGEAGGALGEISGSIEQVNSAISQIASSAVEQSAGVEEISRNVENVSTVSKQSATSAQELATYSEQLNSEVKSLEQLMNQFKV